MVMGQYGAGDGDGDGLLVYNYKCGDPNDDNC